MVSLFEKKRLNGYWPCFTDDPELLGEGEEVKLAVSGDSFFVLEKCYYINLFFF